MVKKLIKSRKTKSRRKPRKIRSRRKPRKTKSRRKPRKIRSRRKLRKTRSRRKLRKTKSRKTRSRRKLKKTKSRRKLRKTKSRRKSRKTKSRKTKSRRLKMNHNVRTLTIPAGTILYRTQPNNCLLKISKCIDTGKKGIYFSSGKYVPLGMILEYNKNMYMCKYKTKRKITMYVGKYSFRYLEPTHFFRTPEDLEKGIFIFNRDPIKSYNHIDDLLPIHEFFNKEIWNKLNEYEYFITNPDDVESISEPEYINVQKATQILKEKEKKL